MKRFLILLSVLFLSLAFCAPCEAGRIRDWFKNRRDKPAVERVERKVEVDRERKVLRVRPACPGGTCPVR